MNQMRYNPAAVANSILEVSSVERRALTPMQLLKLVYISHGWHLAVSGEPLFNEPVEAWRHGPVIPSLYQEFKHFKKSPVTRTAYSVDPVSLEVTTPFIQLEDTETNRLIRWVWKNYGHLNGIQLSELTHQPGTPWSQTVEKVRSQLPVGEWLPNGIIPNELIRKHYLELWSKRNAN